MGIDGIASLSQAIIDGKHLDSERLTSELLASGLGPGEILEKGLLPGMDVVGRRFKNNEIFLPNVLVAARAMKMSMKLLEPLLAGSGHQPKGKVLVGTVKGDIHDIGKNLVSVMLQGSGYTVVDIGIDCTTDKFLTGVAQHHPDIVGLSAMLTTTMTYMKPVIEHLRANGVTLPIIVGGAPISKEFADEIHADGSARNAMDAVEMVKRIFSSGHESPRQR